MSHTFLIAEIGQAHDGSLGILHSYIDALSKTGIDAVKFQTHIAEAESSIHEPFRVNFSYEDKTRFDYWSRMQFTSDQWKEIKAHCEAVGLEFMSSPFSIAAVDLLEEIGVKRYKIGSGEVSNFLMLEKIAKTSKPIILSSGMSSYEELDQAAHFLDAFKNELCIMQCTTSYPTSAENVGLNVISELQERFPNTKIGFSDHSGELWPSLAATTLGVAMLEFHAVFDKRMFGPDAKSSLEIDEIIRLVEGVRYISKARMHRVDKSENTRFKELKGIFEKSLAVNADLPAGHIICFEDLETKKPAGKGISAKEYKSVIGKSLTRNLHKYDFIDQSDIE